MGRNLLAILVLAGASAVIHMNVQPEPVGAGTGLPSRAANRPTLVAPVPPPPPQAVSVATAGNSASSDPTGSPSASPETGGVKGPATASAQPSSTRALVAVQSEVLTGRMAILMNLLMLEKSQHVLENVSDYTATFYKQERINGELSEGQLMELKMRHQPFSIYMKWLTGHKGRQVLYVEGENENKMLVKFGGWKRRLPALKLDPNSSLALAEARYPITKVGMLELVREAVRYRRRDLDNLDKLRCILTPDYEFEGYRCYAFTIEYTDPAYSTVYRKSIFLIDQNSYLPVAVKNYTWPDQVDQVDDEDLDGSTLVEFYSYTDVRLNQRLADSEFDRHNKKYRF